MRAPGRGKRPPTWTNLGRGPARSAGARPSAATARRARAWPPPWPPPAAKRWDGEAVVRQPMVRNDHGATMGAAGVYSCPRAEAQCGVPGARARTCPLSSVSRVEPVACICSLSAQSSASAAALAARSSASVSLRASESSRL
eukprot:6962657-Prymnesium_polylepis.2